MTNFLLGRRQFLGGATKLVALTAVGSAFGSRLALAATDPVVETAFGRVRGINSAGVHVFRSIPYAGDAGGKNRFRPPVAPQAWTGVRDAITFGPSAQQPVGAAGPAEFAWYWPTNPVSEDSLTLSIYTPETGGNARRPVLVWLHGGAFAIGSGDAAGFDGSHLAQSQDVVVVCINHRLNLFGSLFIGEHQDQLSPESGNVGVLDQIAALKWVRDNIAAFGGSADNVTIFGQSGGAAKVAALLGAPAAKGLFHRAVIQSSSGGWRLATPEGAARSGHALLKQFDLSTKDAGKLRDIPADKLLAAMGKAIAELGGAADFRPTLDGVVFKHHPFDPTASALSRDIPLLIGATANEATFFLAGNPKNFSLTAEQTRARVKRFLRLDDHATHALIAEYEAAHPKASPSELLIAIAGDYNYRLPTFLIADRKAAQGGAPVYAYQFNWKSPARDGVLGSPHTGEVPFIFGTLDAAKALIQESPDRNEVRDRLGEIWGSFARGGVPQTKAVSGWKPYTEGERTTAVIGAEWKVENDLLAGPRKAFKNIPPYEYSFPVTFTKD